jgi:ADP-ribose pyrophosphatase YjhB (NUDIX family)
MSGTRFYCAYPGCQGNKKKNGPFFGTRECPGGHELVCGPQVTVDAILEHRGRIVLIQRRKGDVAAGAWALPGGYVEFRERLVDAIVREVAEETGLEAAQVRQFGVYDDPYRDMTDSRNNISIVHTALGTGTPAPGPEVAAVRCFTYEEIRDREFRPGPKDTGLGVPLVLVAPDMQLNAGEFDAGAFTIGFDHADILSDYFRSVRTSA